MKKFCFFLLLALSSLCCRPNHDLPARIGLLRLGKFDDQHFAQAKKEIELFYNAKAIDLGKRDLPQIAYYPPRNRYRADKIIKWLRETRPDSVDYIMGLTASDISHTKDEIADFGIMGLAYNPGRSGVVSTFRVGKGAKDKGQFADRYSKLVLHELGHNFGLPHCANAKHCLMQDACGTVKTLDSEAKSVCKKCKSRLGNLLR